MKLINLNFFTALIFIFLLGIIIIFLYKKYYLQRYFNRSFNLLSSSQFFYIKYIFLIISLIIILFGIFGIKYGEKKLNNEAKGIDMMFVVDVSKSMNVADIKDSNYAYTRLDVIKDSISKYISSHKEDRFGLIIFAGDAVSTIPLTTDHDLFLTFLKGVDYRNLTKQGSDFEKALSLGISRFDNNNTRSKALVFVSDGGDPDDIIIKDNVKQIIKKTDGISYFVVGVGTNVGGKIIKGRDVFGRLFYQRYRGQYVISKINKSNLKDIASSLKGENIYVTNVGDLAKLNKGISSLEKKVITKNINGELGDYGRYITIYSFIFFILYLILYLIENKFTFYKKNNE